MPSEPLISRPPRSHQQGGEDHYGQPRNEPAQDRERAGREPAMNRPGRSAYRKADVTIATRPDRRLAERPLSGRRDAARLHASSVLPRSAPIPAARDETAVREQGGTERTGERVRQRPESAWHDRPRPSAGSRKTEKKSLGSGDAAAVPCPRPRPSGAAFERDDGRRRSSASPCHAASLASSTVASLSPPASLVQRDPLAHGRVPNGSHPRKMAPKG